jgi:hypothetical protein
MDDVDEDADDDDCGGGDDDGDGDDDDDGEHHRDGSVRSGRSGPEASSTADGDGVLSRERLLEWLLSSVVLAQSRGRACVTRWTL